MLTCSVLPAWMTQGSSSPSLTPSLLTPLPLPSVSLCACAVPSNFVLFLLGPPCLGDGSLLEWDSKAAAAVRLNVQSLGETWKRCDLPVPALHVKGNFFPQPELTPCISFPSAVCP